MAYSTVIFRRYTGDPKHWWHWRSECGIFQSAPGQKKRGYTFVYVTKNDGSRPTTYWLCPGCHAVDERVRTNHHPYLVKKIVVLPGKIIPKITPAPVVQPSPVPLVPRYYYTGANI